MNRISLAEYRQQIEGVIQDGRYDEAIAHGRHILEWYPHHVGAYWLLGRAMLEAGQDDQAMDMFQRVLSADPEHMPAWVGMSEAAKRRGDLEDAVWYLQRAFELATDDESIALELRHLYGELEGSEPSRLPLTESALAKLYLRGNLLTRAITELRQLIEEHPDRLDLRVALAEALWRDGQRLQASQVCREILEEQPYVLKANLIMGEIWSSSGRRVEGDTYLDRAEAVDPENEMAQELFGSASPLAPQEPQIEPKAYEHKEDQAGWVIEEEKPAAVEAEEAAEAEIDAFASLRELAGEPKPPIEPPVEPTEEEELAEDGPSAQRVSREAMVEKDVLDWLRELEEEESTPSPGKEMEEEEISDSGREMEGVEQESLAHQPGEAPEEIEQTDIPDWLQDLVPRSAETLETTPPEPAAAIAEEEMPEDLASERLDEEALEIKAFAEMAEAPAWLDSDELPSGDDALAWLARLAEGKEEELHLQVEPEGETLPTEEEPEAILSAEEEASPRGEAVSPSEAATPAEDGGEVTPRPLEEEVPATSQVEPFVEEEARPIVEPVSPAEPIVEAPIEDLDRFIASRQAYATEHPDDHEAQLELARVLWQGDKLTDAVEAYEELIVRRELLDEVIADLEDYTEQRPNARVMQSLGDAYVRNDQLQDALDIYRQALATL